MNRRNLSQALLATTAGSALLSTRSQAQTSAAQGYPPETGETGVIDVSYPRGHILRYETTPQKQALQNAIDSADARHPEVFVPGTNVISQSIVIPASKPGIYISGSGRYESILTPGVNSFSGNPARNAMFVNEGNNSHLHLSKLRCHDGGYTGKFLCAVEHRKKPVAQALYSAVIDDCWFSFSANNSGYFHGGFSNLLVTKTVFEASKHGCFILEGLGNGDQQHIGVTMNYCWDSYIAGAVDTEPKNMISVNGLHAYAHHRGRLFDIQNGHQLQFNDIVLEPSVDNIGDTGLFKFKNCTAVLCTNFVSVAAPSVPACAVGIEIDSNFTGKFANGRIEGVVGLKFTGKGRVDITLDNIDFTGCTYAVHFASGATAGTIRTRNCRFNNSKQYGILCSASGSWSWYSENDEFVNAGMDGVSTGQLMELDTSGEVRFVHTRLGRDDPAAAAAYYIGANGTGSVKFIRPNIVGRPPQGLKTKSQLVEFDREQGYGGVLSAAETLELPFFGDSVVVSGGGNTAITSIAADNCLGRRMTLTFLHGGTVRDGSNLKLAGTLTATPGSTLTLLCSDGVNWYELSRSVN